MGARLGVAVAAILVAAACGSDDGPTRTLPPTVCDEVDPSEVIADPGTDLPKVLVVGDEVACTAGAGLQEWAEARGSMTVLDRAAPGCGLVVGDCDWADQLAAFDPELVIVSTAAADVIAGVAAGAGGDDDERVAEGARALSRQLTAGGATLVWLSGPRIEPGDPARMVAYNDTVAAALSADADVHPVDLYGWLEEQPGGATADVRRLDGVRFSGEGAAELAEWVGPTIEGLLPECEPTVEPSTTEPPPPDVVEVLVAGDSLSRGILPPLEAALTSDECSVRHRAAGGFLFEESGPGWEETLGVDPPDVIVLLFATWENFALRGGEILDPADPAWPEVYRRTRIDPWVALVREAGVEVVWVGMPLVRDPVTSAEHQQLNAVWSDVAADEPAITWVDGAAVLAGPDGGYLEVDDSVDPPLRLFNVDGLHLCPAGGGRLAAVVLDVLTTRFGLPAAAGWEDGDWVDDPDAYRAGECPDPVSG